jgi:hypothetical protein
VAAGSRRKAILGLDVACFRRDFQVAIGNRPLRGAAIFFRDPLGNVLAVEKNDGVGRRLAWPRLACSRFPGVIT